jgi:hypothetical protein
MEVVRKSICLKGYAQSVTVHNLPESISPICMPYRAKILVPIGGTCIIYVQSNSSMAGTKGVEKLETFVCMRYASALSAVHNMVSNISSNTYLRPSWYRLRWCTHDNAQK